MQLLEAFGLALAKRLRSVSRTLTRTGSGSGWQAPDEVCRPWDSRSRKAEGVRFGEVGSCMEHMVVHNTGWRLGLGN